MGRPSARDLLDLVLDEGSWESWDAAPDHGPISEEYAADLAAARERSGEDESVITGRGLMHGRPVAVVASEFRFLAGSIGRAAADRLVAAIRRATAEGLPLLAAPASGGTRMQEGTPAFVQMVRIGEAVAAHRAAGLPYLVYLRHPTTGGVMASWGSLGHMTVAEPGALLGFLGPRVYSALYGEEFPEGVQTAENLVERGIIDGVVPPEEIADLLDRVLTILLARPGRTAAVGGRVPDPAGDRVPDTAGGRVPDPAGGRVPDPAGGRVPDPAGGRVPDPAGGRVPDPRDEDPAYRDPAYRDPAYRDPAHRVPEAVVEEGARAPVSTPPGPDAWDAITRSRRPERPGVRRLLRYAATDVVPLNGTGEGEADPGLLIALARFGDAPCVFLGQDRRGQSVAHPMGPGALREARRGMRLAEELGLPLVTVIDTPGAALSAEAENGGIAGEIARSLADLVTLRAPTLCLMLGEGTGGGALALLPADRIVAAQHGWLSPLPPEGASAIVHRDTAHAAAMARAQRVGAHDLAAIGVVDRIVPEHPDAADEPEAFCARVGAVLAEELTALMAHGPLPPAERVQRYA